MADWNVAWESSHGSSVEEEPLVITSKFGDGYEQRSPDGINNSLRKFSLVFKKVPEAQMKAMRDFLRSKGGVTPFTFTPYFPLDTDSSGNTVQVLVVCRKFTFKAMDFNCFSTTLVFEEVIG